jgi:uncharacterized protein
LTAGPQSPAPGGSPWTRRTEAALRDAVIVDTHVHLGVSHSTGVRITSADLVSAMREYRLSACLVMPQPTDPQALQTHTEIAKLARSAPGRVFGIALLDPRLSRAQFEMHAERLLDRDGFVALKLHTFGHRIAPDDDACHKVFLAARRYQRPVMIHTGLGGPHTLPQRAESMAQRYSDLPIVLCHAGFGAFWREAIEVAEKCDNVLLEPSWSPGFAIGLMVERLGANRIMFGSDHPSNIATELVKLAGLGLSPRDLTAVLGGNAINVFNLAAVPASFPSASENTQHPVEMDKQH